MINFPCLFACKSQSIYTSKKRRMMKATAVVLVALWCTCDAQPDFGSLASQNHNLRFPSHGAPACWKDAQTRGVGKPVHDCPDKDEESCGLLCYPKCQDGFQGVGPVCWQECEEGFKDFGAFCVSKSQGIYAKKTTTRGLGHPAKCSSEEEQDEIFFGLCYPHCKKDGAEGIGPFCWDKCPEAYPVQGGPLCCKTEQDCKTEEIGVALKLPLHIAKAVIDGKNPLKEFEDLKQIVEDIIGYSLPLCHKV